MGRFKGNLVQKIIGENWNAKCVEIFYENKKKRK